jgi:L-lactate utilization protein LutB
MDILEIMDFQTPASPNQIQRTIEAVASRGVAVEFVENGKAAFDRLREIIPPGADVMTGASMTLRQIGLEEYLGSGRHPWHNVKAEYLAEKDPARQAALRRQAALSEYFLASVHAIAETGEIVVASATGSQIAPYAYTSRNVIWVAGVQKIVPTLADAVRRVREYVLPLEDRRAQSQPGPKIGGFIGKLLIFEKEAGFLNRTLRLILVNERLGF